jgi:hypothetical protein
MTNYRSELAVRLLCDVRYGLQSHLNVADSLPQARNKQFVIPQSMTGARNIQNAKALQTLLNHLRLSHAQPIEHWIDPEDLSTFWRHEHVSGPPLD